CLGSCSTPASSTETARGKQHLAILQQLIRLTTSAFCLGSCSTPASSTETAGGKQHLAILQQLIRLTTSAFCFCTINETSKRKAAKRQAVPRFKVLQQLDKADHIITFKKIHRITLP
ncbi:Phosphoglycolate phosphatase 1B, chloroplastic, partial [Frankliniella fusca]